MAGHLGQERRSTTQQSESAVLGAVGRGLFPKSVPAWGTERAALVPGSRPTNGRDNFFIHGGLEPGSVGCIDLGPNEKAYFDAVRSTGGAQESVALLQRSHRGQSAKPVSASTQPEGAS